MRCTKQEKIQFYTESIYVIGITIVKLKIFFGLFLIS